MTDTPETPTPEEKPKRSWREWRRDVLTRPLLAFYKSRLPPMSTTEREAIEAGTVWWDAALFTGKPDWPILLNAPKAGLSDEEGAFLNGPTE